MNLFMKGSFSLHSGELSQVKVECDALTQEDIECIAWMLSTRLPEFGIVHGVPSGGLRLAQALHKYASNNCLRTLLVDDVLTTGKSITQYRDSLYHWLPETDIAAVIFARGRCPNWVYPLWQLNNIRFL